MRFLFPLTFIVVAVMLGYFIVNPMYKDVIQLRTDVETYNIAIGSSAELQNTSDALIESYKKINKDNKDRLAHLIPDTMNNLEFVLEIEKMANAHGMPIDNIKFEKQDIKPVVQSASQIVIADSTINPQDSVPYNTFPVEFETQGTYSNFVLFVKDLEYNLRLVDVKSASFTVPEPGVKLEAGVDPNVHTYKLKAETYWLK